MASYPKWKYCSSDAGEGVIVESEAEELALGSGWKDSPADFEVKAPEKTPKKAK